MTKRGARIKHPKQRGEWAELCFMVSAAERGLQVSKPWGDMAHYDFVVEHAGHLARVQVKSTINRRRTHYDCHMCDCHGSAYKGNAFDFVAAYLIPEDIWYIIPAGKLRNKTGIGLYPRLKRSKYEPYREAWHLLRGGTTIDSIQAFSVLSSRFSVKGKGSSWLLVSSGWFYPGLQNEVCRIL